MANCFTIRQAHTNSQIFVSDNNLQENKESELRQDLVSHDWVIIAPTRGKAPEKYSRNYPQMETPWNECPFCHLEKERHFFLTYDHGKIVETSSQAPKSWTTSCIANIFPIMCRQDDIGIEKEGEFYEKISASGFCEIVATNGHSSKMADMDLWQIEEIFSIFKQRYLALMDKKFVNYISIFQNCGFEAGATQSHNHAQIITTPLLDGEISRSLQNAQTFYRQHHACAYCQMLEWEIKNSTRIVWQNEHFVAFCPFASKAEFEIVIAPKFHSPYFEDITGEQIKSLAEIFSKVLKSVKSSLDDPDYNYYLHTAPCDEGEYPFYHWRFTLYPKVKTTGGFELATKLEVDTLPPEEAAQYLAKHII